VFSFLFFSRRRTIRSHWIIMCCAQSAETGSERLPRTAGRGQPRTWGWREGRRRKGGTGRDGTGRGLVSEGGDFDGPRRGERERGGLGRGVSAGSSVWWWSGDGQALRTEHLIGCRLENSMLADLWRGPSRVGIVCGVDGVEEVWRRRGGEGGEGD
jgi:hypothetical protein